MSTTTRLLLASACAALGIAREARQGKAPLNWSSASVVTLAGDTIQADSAWLTVPMRHAKPGGPTIQLPVLRMRSTASRPGSPIIYLAGGPGNSGLAALRDPDRGALLTALRDLGDVILYDQRGTGRSRPSVLIPTSLGLPTDRPVTDPSIIPEVANRLRPYLDTLRQRGVDLDAYNTAESADDVEALRQALGVERVTLWGHSYGSHLAFAVLKRHGNRVDRAIVGGVNGLHQRWRLPSDGDTWIARIDSAIKADASLRQLVPDLAGSLRALLAKLDREPIRATAGNRTVFVGGDEVRTFLALQSGDIALAGRLPLIVAQLSSGDASRLAPELLRTLHSRPVGPAMTYTMHYASGVDAARARRIESEAPQAILRNAINYPFDIPEFRALWNVTDLGAEFRAPLTTNVPTLFLSGSIDGRTSISDAEEIRNGFRRSAHIVIDGAGHNFYTSTPAVLARMRAFLTDGALRNEHLRARFVPRGPDEPRLVTELREIALRDGADAATTRLETFARSQTEHLTELVVGTASVLLANEDKRPELAIALATSGRSLFPESTFLLDRLGEWKAATGDASGARVAWTEALQLDPYDSFAASQLKKLPR
jgi:pimeloyl-ACP methyl ester carboxylesterase